MLFPVSVLYRSDIIHFFEHPVKVLYILITNGFCNAFYCRAASLEHGARLLHTDLLQYISESHT